MQRAERAELGQVKYVGEGNLPSSVGSWRQDQGQVCHRSWAYLSELSHKKLTKVQLCLEYGKEQEII